VTEYIPTSITLDFSAWRLNTTSRLGKIVECSIAKLIKPAEHHVRLIFEAKSWSLEEAALSLSLARVRSKAWQADIMYVGGI